MAGNHMDARMSAQPVDVLASMRVTRALAKPYLTSRDYDEALRAASVVAEFIESFKAYDIAYAAWVASRERVDFATACAAQRRRCVAVAAMVGVA